MGAIRGPSPRTWSDGLMPVPCRLSSTGTSCSSALDLGGATAAARETVVRGSSEEGR